MYNIIKLNKGWNLISVQNEININDYKIIECCYTIVNNNYIYVENMIPGKGYWVKCNSNQNLIIQKLNSNLDNHALFLLGEVNYFGQTLKSHHKVAERTKTWLINNRDFNKDNIILCENANDVKNEINKIKNLLKLPNKFALIWYTGHAIQIGSNEKEDYMDDEYWTLGMISDNLLTDIINSTHEESNIIIIADNCFSDGMIDKWKILNKTNWLFISASREKGLDEYTSAFFTGDGGYMTYSLIEELNSKDYYTRNDLLDLLHSKYWKDPTGNILHKPIVIPENSKVLW